MNIKQAKEEIKNSVKAYLQKDAYGDYQIPAIRQRPLLLIGPPGIGKTQIMEQIARECEIGLVSYTITHHTRQSAVGLPFIKEETFEDKTYSITQYTMSEIIASVYNKMKSTGLKEGVLFIDEINCVSETLAPTMLQFLQCKTFGNEHVPEGWIIVAAGNPPEYNKSVRDFDMVTLDRVRYMKIDASYEVWKEYAYDHHIHNALLSFLELKPNKFYHVESDVDGMKFVTARGWEDLSNVMKLYESLHIDITEEIIKEFIHHEDIAEDVYAYYVLYKKYQDDYGIQDILQGRVPTSVYARIFSASFDERLSVVNLLVDGLQVHFHAYTKDKEMVDIWYDFLKQYRTILHEEIVCKSAFDTLLEKHIQMYETKVKEEVYTKEDMHTFDLVFTKLKESSNQLHDSMDKKEAFSTVRESFDTQVKELQDKDQMLEMYLHNAFTFMEEAFTSGQEMLVFVSTLAISSASSMYLSEHTIDVYEKYKEELMIGKRRTQLLDELERD